MEDKLNFPIIRDHLPGPRRLPMRDYLRFVQWNLRYLVNLEKVRELKKRQAINVPFKLKP